MKKLLIVIISLSLSSCTVFYGPNYNNADKVKCLSIGMTKQEAINVMGDRYEVESVSEKKDGVLEVIKYSSFDTFLLHFLDGKLVVFEKYYPPYVPEQKITVKHEKE